MTTAVTAAPHGRSCSVPVARTHVSPSDFGEILKPFVFLDLFDHESAPCNGGLHPTRGSPP
jgi:hypothetical protein